MSRFLNTLLIGMSELGSLSPNAPIREHLVSHPIYIPPASDAEAIASDWYRVGQDLIQVLAKQDGKAEQEK